MADNIQCIPSFSSGPAGCVFHSLCLAYLESDRLYLVFLLDGQVETGLVQPGHLVVLLTDAPLDLVHDRGHAFTGEAWVGAPQAAHLHG